MKYTIIHVTADYSTAVTGVRTKVSRIETVDGEDLFAAMAREFINAGNVVCVFEGWPKYVGEK